MNHLNMGKDNQDQQHLGTESDYRELKGAAEALISALEQYVEPKPGTPYMHRARLLEIKNKTKALL